jgi:hypothetical protein
MESLFGWILVGLFFGVEMGGTVAFLAAVAWSVSLAIRRLLRRSRDELKLWPLDRWFH